MLGVSVDREAQNPGVARESADGDFPAPNSAVRFSNSARVPRSCTTPFALEIPFGPLICQAGDGDRQCLSLYIDINCGYAS